VPGVYALDTEAGWLCVEWIEGEVVRARLNEWLKTHRGRSRDESELKELLSLMRIIGLAVGRLHKAAIVHGDLTTSNMMLRPTKCTEDQSGTLEGEIVLIDFGLASQSVQDEDRAVDLYVLERAFGSTHPSAEDLFEEVLKAYAESFKGANTVLKRLEDVRMRGRKKSMIG
jgi:TP53 regulating kinase-like protein